MRKLILCVVMAFFAVIASAQELNVGSFNVRLLAKGDYKKHNGWDLRKTQLCDMINLEAFDVFGAQEVKKPQLDDMLAMLPDYRYVGVGRDDGKEKGEYSPVFYRKDKFKLLDCGTFWLSDTPDQVSKGWDGACRRVCSWAYLQRKSDKARFYFLSTHLDHKGKVAKMEGAKLVVKFVKEHCKGENVIIVGDFNVDQDSAPYNVFAKSGVLNDTYDIAKYRFAPTGTFNAFQPRRYTDRRIDHIFVSNDIKVSRYGTLTYHYFRDMKAEQQDMGSAAPKEIKGENRDVKCISDHYAIQSFLTLNNNAKPKKVNELNVGSFNIRNGRSLRPGEARPNGKKNDYSKYDGWDDRKQYVCDMVNLEAFDVFGAQEVRKGQLDDMLAMLPDYDYIGVGRDHGDDRGEFSPVFYRKDILKKLDGGTFWLSPTPEKPSKGWDAKYNRICSWGVFLHKPSGKKICFMNVHFDHRGVQARIEASKQIAEYVKKNCKGMTVILSGDFNVTQHSDSYKTLVDTKVLKDTYNLAKYRFEPTGTFNSFNPRRYTTHRIDHLFVSKGVKVDRWGVLTYHYLRTPTAEEVAAAQANPKKKKFENRDVKCISDHYAIQSFIKLK